MHDAHITRTQAHIIEIITMLEERATGYKATRAALISEDMPHIECDMLLDDARGHIIELEAFLARVY